MADLVCGAVTGADVLDAINLNTNNKVDKEGTKVLSDENFTTADKTAVSDNTTKVGGVIAGTQAVTKTQYDPTIDMQTYSEGLVFYDKAAKSASYYTDIPDVLLHDALAQVMRVVNRSGVTLTRGMACCYGGAVDGATGRPTATLALADNFLTAQIMGNALHDIADGAEGWLTTFGEVVDVDIATVMESGQTMVLGEALYLSSTAAGKFTTLPPDIASRIGGFISGVQDSTPGNLFVKNISNMNLPGVTAFLQEQLDPVYSATATPITIDGYSTTGNIVMESNATAGTITVANAGVYAINFMSTMSFATSNGTRTIYLDIYDTIAAESRFKYTLSIPKDATEIGCSFTFPSELDVSTLAMQISSVPDIDITLDTVSFDLASKHIR